jgi:uridine kinase
LIRRFAELAAFIRETPPRIGSRRLVAIDGQGGAGKSTFARRLSVALGGATVIATDDFASWEVPIGWWPDLEAQVLEPMAAGLPVRYRRYDWDARRHDRWIEPELTDVVLLEGVSSSRRAIAERLSLAIWIEAPRATRMLRGVRRDGEAMRSQWEAWLADEDLHFLADDTRERANLRVDGAPSLPHDPEREFVVID